MENPHTEELECKTPIQDQSHKNSPKSLNSSKSYTPDPLQVPKAFKYPERYRSPTDLMVSPITKGILARNRKTASLLPPSIHQSKVEDVSRDAVSFKIAMNRKRKAAMDNEIINNNQTTKHSPERLSSSSSSSESSTSTIDKDKLVTETKVSPSEADIDDKNHKHDNSSRETTVQGYDPNRIPASVFTSNSKPGTPMEWSVASNESLFSIHMGNTSFSRDHVFMLYRSGEFPPIPMDSNERKSEASIYNSKWMSEEDGIVLEPELPKYAALDGHGDEARISNSSIQSFQFPLLEAGGNAAKEAENWQSPKCSRLNEQRKGKSKSQSLSVGHESDPLGCLSLLVVLLLLD